ncbi:MAG: hypothetical protein NDJ94_04625 [Vicinamibacteria bacterium]|nr:hypothetical protein [Vicinamibacteria bacterium]
MALFGKKKIRLSTNAPRHWPEMEAESWSADKASLNYLFLGATLSKALPGARLSFLQRRLHDDGVLDIPLLVEENGQRTAVFAYAAADAESAARYSGTRAVLRQRDGMNAVYYAPGPIAPAKPAPATRPLQLVDFITPEGQRGATEYAGWWPSETDPTLAHSPALGALDRWFAAADGRGSVLFSAFVSLLELAESKGGQQLFALPEKPLGLPLEGPGDLAVCLHASAAEGLWFAIDTNADPLARNRLLVHLAALAEDLQKEIDASGRSPRPEDRQGQAHWHAARADALAKQAAGGAGLRVLCLAGTRRFPGATTDEERRAAEPAPSVAPTAAPQQPATGANEPPSDIAVDFGFEQMDRAFAEMARRVADGSAAEGDPALHPFLCVRRGESEWTTRFHYCLQHEVTALAAGRVFDDGPPDLVATVTDAYLREGETRSDALFVQVEVAGGGVSHVFAQRYTGRPPTPNGRPVLLGAEGSILVPGPRPAPADSGNADIARECVATTLEWTRIGDPTGMQLYQPGEPLFFPSATLFEGEHRGLQRFASGGLAWALRACRQALAEKPEVEAVVFVCDDVRERDGRFDRGWRVQVQRRGGPAVEYRQAYDEPAPSREFTLRGELRPVGIVESLFPA